MAKNELSEIHSAFFSVQEFRQAFEARWTWSALARVDHVLHDKLRAQVSKFDKAMVVSDVDEVDKHASATIRGFKAAISAMEKADEPDDAYLVGQDRETGLRVIVAANNATLAHKPDRHGENVFLIQVDELARLFSSTPQFRLIAAAAKAFPGAGVYVPTKPDEPVGNPDFLPASEDAE